MNSLNAVNKILAFKDLLRTKFPAAHAPRQPAVDRLETGISGLDIAGLVRGAVTEVVGEGESVGVGLLIAGLLQRETAVQEPLALVDARDSFDPCCVPPGALERLFWVRCREVSVAMRVADLLLRDGNLPLVILDLQGHASREAQRLPASSWHRLRMLAEQSGVALCVFSPCALVPCARSRLLLLQRYTLEALERPRRELLEHIQVKLVRSSLVLHEANQQLPSALAG